MFNLTQALDAIKNKPEFTAKDKGQYTVIDYNLSCPTTFTGETEEETMILLNLRGTAFNNETGEIVRLPYHKFFNYGEKPEQDKKLSFNTLHAITQKLDGSMLSPIFTESGFVWATRAGVTDVSKLVDKFLNGHHKESTYKEFIFSCRIAGMTPVFEYCSPENRVVLSYPEPQLVLTGIRCMETGAYNSYKLIEYLGKLWDIPVVKSYKSVQPEEFKEFLKQIFELKDDEGVVIRFESGTMKNHMIKVKAEEYVKMHKTLDNLKWTHDVMQLVFCGMIDDCLSLLDPVRRNHIELYATGLLSVLEVTVVDLGNEYKKYRYIESQKEFAEAVKDNKFRRMLFKMRIGKESAFELVLKYCIKTATNQAGAIEVANFLKFSGAYK